MNHFEITLSAGYASGWGLDKALRELIANGLDGQTRGKWNGSGRFSVKHRNGLLTLTNEQTELNPSAWVLGEGGQAGTGVIGQFHEGMKLATMVLCRLGHRVTMWNGDEKWSPVLEASEKFGGVPILTVKRRKVRHQTDFIVEIEDIDADIVADVKSKFLIFDTDFDESATLRTTYQDGPRVLLQPQYRGRLYSHGVFIQTRDDLSFGYELDCEMNRDRTILDEWDTKYEVGGLLAGASVWDEERFRGIVLPTFFSEDPNLETAYEYSTLSNSAKFQHMVREYWDEHYGPDVMVAESSSQQQEAERLGLRSVVMNPLIRRVVDTLYTSVRSAMSEQATRVSRELSLSDLTSAEGQVWQNARRLALLVTPSLNLVDIRVAEFVGHSTSQHEADGVIWINRVHLADQRSALKVWARLIAGEEGTPGMEGTLDALARMTVAEMEREKQVEEDGELAELIGKIKQFRNNRKEGA